MASSVLLSDINKLTDHLYEVQGSTPGSVYTVNTTPGSPRTCTCTGYATKRNKNKRDSGFIQGTEEYGNVEGSCKHLTAILEMEGQGKAEQAERERELLRRRRAQAAQRRTREELLADLEDLA